MTHTEMNNDYLSLLLTEGTPIAPRISTAALLSQPENRPLYDIVVRAPAEPDLYAGTRVALISTDGVEEIEITATLRYFRDRGATVHLLAPRKPTYPPKFGVQIPAIRETHILAIRYMDFGGWIAFDAALDSVDQSDYDAVIVPGGVWNPDGLRGNSHALEFLQTAARAGKPTAAICHGPWVLADAGLLRDKRATCWWSMQKDLVNAGATFVDEPAVVDGNIVTARCPGDLPQFLDAIGAQLTDR